MGDYRKPVAFLLGALVVASLCVALARAPAARAQENPRLANLQVEIWPEFDLPAALVILRGEIAADVALPAAVSLRIPAASGGPLAVATADSDGNLFDLKYERSDAPDFITLTFTVERRVFHVEFYDALSTAAPQRTYTYTWPGGFEVGELTARVQEPAGATGFSVQPDLGPGATGVPDGLVYRRAGLGALTADQTFPITVSYQKTDPRSSADILGLNKPGETATPANGGDGGIAPWLLPLAAVLGAVAGAALLAVWYRRAELFPARAGTRAGRGDRPEDGRRFCSGCGK